MTTTTELKRTWRQEHLADLEQTLSLLERLTAIVEREVQYKEFPTLAPQYIGLAHIRVAETASRLAHDLYLTTHM